MALTVFDKTQIGTVSSSSLVGTTTNDSAATGIVGEYIQSTVTGTSNAAASGVWDDLLNISLTAGDWDVTAMTSWRANGGTWTEADIGISTTAGNSTAGLNVGINEATGEWAATTNAPSVIWFSIPSYRISLTATTTVYLKRAVSYSAGTPRTNGGRISARRVR